MSQQPRPVMIGDFARRCRLPVSTLRYYDRIGLLAPAAAGPSSGYRRHTAAQVPAANSTTCSPASTARPGHDLQVVSLGGHRVAAAPFAAPGADLATCILRGIAGLRTALRRSACARAGPWGATFPLEITDQVSGLVFARAERLSSAPGLATAWLPAARAVRTVHRRPGTLALAYQAVLDRIDHEGWTPAGPVIEEYPALDAPSATSPAIQVTVPLA